jgi:hypothetical protein
MIFRSAMALVIRATNFFLVLDDYISLRDSRINVSGPVIISLQFKSLTEGSAVVILELSNAKYSDPIHLTKTQLFNVTIIARPEAKGVRRKKFPSVTPPSSLQQFGIAAIKDVDYLSSVLKLNSSSKRIAAENVHLASENERLASESEKLLSAKADEDSSKTETESICKAVEVNLLLFKASTPTSKINPKHH